MLFPHEKLVADLSLAPDSCRLNSGRVVGVGALGPFGEGISGCGSNVQRFSGKAEKPCLRPLRGMVADDPKFRRLPRRHASTSAFVGRAFLGAMMILIV